MVDKLEAEAIKIFEEMTALTAGKSVADCVAAYAELWIANICCLRDSREEAKALFRQMQPGLERRIDEQFDHYHAQLDKEPDLFARDAAIDQVEDEEAAPEEDRLPAPVQPLAGWPRARALRDVANYFASCRDNGEQIAIGCIYPWMRDLIVETLRAIATDLTEKCADYSDRD